MFSKVSHCIYDIKINIDHLFYLSHFLYPNNKQWKVLYMGGAQKFDFVNCWLYTQVIALS